MVTKAHKYQGFLATAEAKSLLVSINDLSLTSKTKQHLKEQFLYFDIYYLFQHTNNLNIVQNRNI